MDSFFSKTLALGGTNLTTALVLWSMIIFLLALISGLGYIFIKQLKNGDQKKTTKPRSIKTKGFSD